jgi:hypothetical protein
LESKVVYHEQADRTQEFAPLSDRLLPALRLLFDGYQYANDVGMPLEEFAVSFESLRRLAVAEIDLLWLARKGYVITVGDEMWRDNDSPAVISSQTLFMFSPDGLRYAAQALKLDPKSEVPEPHLPTWDISRRKLKLGDHVVKHFQVPAPNQEMILRCFQEDGWPPQIQDPIPPARNVDPRRRLHDTILALNRCQTSPRIRFRGDGTGVGVYWEIEA